jgi:hypothetical protein
VKSKPKTKRERFESVASKRVQMVIDKLDTLSRCSNTNNYEYSDADSKKMFKAIKEKLRDVELKFNQKSSRRRDTFSFNK